MADRDKPGKLGSKAFTADGSVDSDGYIPRDGSIRTLLQVTADQAGTVQAVLIDAFDETTEYFRPAVAVVVTAGDPEEILFEMPLRQAYRRVFLRYTNTNTTAGTAKFSATDGEL